jgi:hypothetical protein
MAVTLDRTRDIQARARDIQSKIRKQLVTSQELFDLVDELADVAEEITDPVLRSKLAQVMKRLVVVGRQLSDDTSATGQFVVGLIKDIA